MRAQAIVNELEAAFPPRRHGSRLVLILVNLALASVLLAVLVLPPSADGHPIAAMGTSGRPPSVATPILTGPPAAPTAPGDANASTLAPADGIPAPDGSELADGGPVSPHEVFGFVPYWLLDSESGIDVTSLTTIAYFGVSVNGDGSLQESGAGWNGYQSQDLSDLVTRAHSADTRVVLTATGFNQATLDAMVENPGAPTVLATQLTSALQAENLDGVNLDFEGSGPDAGLATFVDSVADQLHAVNSNWQVTVDTYASSAEDPGGWFDVPTMASHVDAFFVMAYGMSGADAGPTSPLEGSGWTVDQAVTSYLSVVSPDQVILGIPFYGNEWPVAGPGAGAAVTGGMAALTYAQIAGLGGTATWDASTDTPVDTVESGGQWWRVYYDDPQSVYQKVEYASDQGLLGVGAWTLGMDGSSAPLLSALDGNQPPTKVPDSGSGDGTAGQGTPSPTPSATPTAAPTPTPAPSASPTPTPTPTSTPTPTATPTPGPSPSPSVSPSASSSPADAPTVQPGASG